MDSDEIFYNGTFYKSTLLDPKSIPLCQLKWVLLQIYLLLIFSLIINKDTNEI